MLSFYSGLRAVALFSLGMKFALILNMTLILPFQMAFQPLLFVSLNDEGIKDKLSRLLTYFIFAIVALSIAVLVGTKAILPLIAPPDYFQAFSVLTFSLPAWGFLSLIVFGEALVNITYKTYVTGIIIALSGLFGMLLNYLLIPPLSWYGAIISLNLSSIITGTLILYYGINCYPIKIDWKRILFSISSLILFVFCAFVFRSDKSYIFCLNMLVPSLLVILLARYLHILDDREKNFLGELIRNIQTYMRREKISCEKIK
jgi:O-antigen/teichoic acid export membrane protein